MKSIFTIVSNLATGEQSFQLRLAREVWLIEQYLNGEWFVHYGPFVGMKYIKTSCGSVLAPKIIGSYESLIHS